jgi:hypothetical protein
MRWPTIDAHGIASPSGKDPLLRIVKTISVQRLRWLAMGMIVLATALIFLTDEAHRASSVELLLMWSLVLLAI